MYVFLENTDSHSKKLALIEINQIGLGLGGKKLGLGITLFCFVWYYFVFYYAV